MNDPSASVDDAPADPGNERLDTILANYLEAERLGRAPPRTDWLAGHPDLTDELSAFLDDRDCFRRVAATIPVAPFAFLDGSEATGSAWPIPDVVGGYQILGELGRGGMGVVYKARQPQLQRVVALKMVLDGRHADPRELARFRAEAEAIARLQHPNIVQIHEVGTHEGRPFFSLELVEGRTLAQRIAGRPQPTRESAALVQSLARAIDYAHRQGVVHRDLKPANVLLKIADCRLQTADLKAAICDLQSAIPKITDFGLAKRLEGYERQTRTGAIVGTPAYLSPEQARGTRNVGPAADIYALGGILYELLTGRPPFGGETPLATILQVTNAEVVPPGRRCARVPRDLETICLKCLEKDPGRRYAKAGDLADDLGRFLRGEAVAARPISGLQRASRWCRRRPLVAALLAAVVVLALAGVGGVTFQWRRAEAHLVEADQQRAEADRQRARAEATARDARMVVNDFFTQVSDSTLLNVPGLQPLRKDLLERARRDHQDLLARHGDDPALRRDLAEAQFRLGRITSLLDSTEAGLRQMEIARTMCEDLLRRQPGDPTLRQRLATTQLAIGCLQGQLGRTAEALRSVEASRVVLEELYQADPRASERASSLRIAWRQLGAFHRQRGQLDQAAAWYQRALALAEEQVRRGPTASGRRRVAVDRQSLALVQVARGQLGPARALYAQAVQEAEQLVQENRTSLDARQLLASLYSVCGLLDTTPRLDEPLTREHFEKMRATGEKARKLLTSLVEENPAVLEYREQLAIGLHNLGRAEQLLHRYPEAIRAYNEAGNHLVRLLREDHQLFSGYLALAEVRDHLGECQLQAGQPTDAEQTLAEARAGLEDLRRQYPGSQAPVSRLAGVLLHWAQAVHRQGRTEQALAACEEAISLQRTVCAAAPAEGAHRWQLNLLLGQLFRLQVQMGRVEEAAAVCRERLDLSAGTAGLLFEVGRDLAGCACLVGFGPERETLVEQAVRALRQADRSGFANLAQWERAAALDGLRDNPEIRQLHENVQARARGRQGVRP